MKTANTHLGLIWKTPTNYTTISPRQLEFTGMDLQPYPYENDWFDDVRYYATTDKVPKFVKRERITFWENVLIFSVSVIIIYNLFSYFFHSLLGGQ